MQSVQIDSPLILFFSATCVAPHAYGSVLGGEHWTRNKLGVWPWTHFATSDPRQYPQFLMHVLGHVSWEHLNGNLVNLLLVGPACEREYGSFNLLKIILWTAIFSAFSHMAFGPHNGVQLGASGVVFSLILLSSLVAAQEGRIPLTFVCQVVVWCWTEIGAALFAADRCRAASARACS